MGRTLGDTAPGGHKEGDQVKLMGNEPNNQDLKARTSEGKEAQQKSTDRIPIGPS